MEESYQQWHGDNFSTIQHGALADFPFCGPIHHNLTYP
jgi:hypothetical protein